jgi:hypothetical protein
LTSRRVEGWLWLERMSDVIQPASTGRSKCRACREAIVKGDFRFGEQVVNSFGEGDALHWFHMMCAADRRPDKVKAAIEAHEGELPDREALLEVASNGVANGELRFVSHIEKAPSGRATCQQCREKIDKGVWRVALDRSPDGVTPMGGSVHLTCAVDHLGSAGLAARLKRAAERLPPEDRDDALSAIAGLAG